MAKIVLNSITSGFTSVANLNAMFQQIEDEFNNKVLYRDEAGAMSVDLDLGSNNILNVANAVNSTDAVNLAQVQSLIATAGNATASSITFSPAGNIAATDVQAAIEELDTEKAASSHTHVEADITDLQSYLLDITSENVGDLSDVFNSAPADKHVLIYDGVTDNRYENRLLVEADISDLQNYAVVGHTHTESDITDLQPYLLDITGENVGDLSDVFNSTPADRHVLVYDGVTDNRYENRLLVEADISDLQSYALSGHSHTLADITDSGALAALNTVGTAEIDNDSVTYAKMQNVSATDRVLGRDTAGAGDVEEIAEAAFKTMFNLEIGVDVQAHSAVLDATTASFTTADETKLDGIEASADVTDETNVTAAFPISDATALVYDPVDNTKLMRIDVGGIATATTRVLIMPDNDVDLGVDFADASHTHVLADITDSGALAAKNTIATADVDNNAISFAKMQDISTSRVLGRLTAATGDPEELTFAQLEGQLNHDNLVGFVANEHVDHSAVSISAGDGLSGGGDITATRTLDVNINAATDLAAPATNDELLISDLSATNAIKKADVASIVNLADHDALTNFVANEHIDHTAVTLTAGNGLSGGGDISANRSFALDLNELGTETAIAVDDFIAMVDITDSGSQKITYTDFLEGINSLTADATPDGAADYMLSYDASAGTVKKVLMDNLPGGGGGISNVVEDTSPQLGGQLDVNGFAIGNGTLELLDFTETASAVNHLNITNAATGNAPRLSAVGDDVNVDLALIAKGTGDIAILDPADATKVAKLDPASITTATTRTYSFPDESGTFAIAGGAYHDGFSDFVANEHIDHTSVTLTAGVGLTGGGDISANRTFDLDINGLTAQASPGSGDQLVIYDAGLAAHRKVDWDTLPGAGGSAPFVDTTAIVKGSADATKQLRFEVDGLTTSTTRVWTAPDQDLDFTPGTGDFATAAEGDLANTALQNVVEDVSPQLGAQLDVNGFGFGDGTLELLTFTETVSAVNHVNITNAATGNGPKVEAAGDDANVDLVLDGKGTGDVVLAGSNLDVTGNILVSGTVDGRDIATDGSKLDGVEANADITDSANVDDALNGFTTLTAIAAGDFVPFNDISDTNIGKKITFSNFEAALNHDNLTGFVANEHIDHTSIVLTAGVGLTGGGDISANRTFDVDINGATDLVSPATNDELLIADTSATSAVKKADVASIVNLADHDALTNFVANEHIDHTAVTLTAGNGLSGGGDISANRTFDLDLNELGTETSIASGDFLAMVDITDNGSQKITFANLESTLNHDNLAGFQANEHINQFEKHISIEDPTNAEDITVFFTNRAITITEMRAVLLGSATPSVTWTIRHSTNRNLTGNEVVTSGTTTTNTTTGDDITTFNDATIPADSFVWLETTAQSGTVDELHISILGTYD